MMAIDLDYAGGRKLDHVRATAGVGNWLFAAVVLAAYATAGYARWVMPGGYGWNAEWERANFLYNAAAGSASACFAAGVLHVTRKGWRVCPCVIVVGTVAAGALPLTMLVFARRWMQSNFA